MFWLRFNWSFSLIWFLCVFTNNIELYSITKTKGYKLQYKHIKKIKVSKKNCTMYQTKSKHYFNNIQCSVNK